MDVAQTALSTFQEVLLSRQPNRERSFLNNIEGTSIWEDVMIIYRKAAQRALTMERKEFPFDIYGLLIDSFQNLLSAESPARKLFSEEEISNFLNLASQLTEILPSGTGK